MICVFLKKNKCSFKKKKKFWQQWPRWTQETQERRQEGHCRDTGQKAGSLVRSQQKPTRRTGVQGTAHAGG